MQPICTRRDRKSKDQAPIQHSDNSRLSSISRITDRQLTHGRQCSVAGSIEDIFLSCSEPKRNVVEPSLVSVGTAKMIHCRRRCWWWCVQDVRFKITMHRCDVWTCMSAANALDSVVQMYVGHQMLSTTGMELCNHQKFRILAQNW